MKIADAAQTFLSQHRIAVTGVSREGTQHGANVVYQRLKDRGYTVFAVNPNTPEVDGDRTYPDLASIPGGVDAVVIGTSAAHAPATMREIVDLGIKYAWMHRSFGEGSVSPEATRIGRDAGVLVIDGGCPLMFGETSDGGHRFMCRMLKMTKAVPRQVA
ncbi:MAG: CoA-binding protein [Candidatus Nanopelagicales bacterium]